MSFSGQAILALHIAAAIFALGPGTAAIMSTPRYIRKGNAAVVGFLYRTTRIYAIGSVLVLVFGLILTQIQHEFSKWWISVSITLYVVAAVLLVMIMRDQRAHGLTRRHWKSSVSAGTAASSTAATSSTAVVPASHPPVEDGNGQPPTERSVGEEGKDTADDGEKQAAVEHPASAPAPAPVSPAQANATLVAAVEQARISSLSGVVALIWLVTLVLMVWK